MLIVSNVECGDFSETMGFLLTPFQALIYFSSKKGKMINIKDFNLSEKCKFFIKNK